MLNVHQLSPQDFVGLSPCAAAELAAKVLHYIGQQSQHIAQQGQQIESQAQAIQFKDAKINSIMFELRRLKAWRFDAKTERMNAEQRQLFEETLAADQADLEAQLAALKAVSKESGDTTDSSTRRQPKRQALPEHLKRVDHHHEPQSTTCGCGQAMVRIGEDVSERLDIIPAQFFVHRHIRGKWTCKCCQTLVQEPVEPQVIDKGMAIALSRSGGWVIGQLPSLSYGETSTNSGEPIRERITAGQTTAVFSPGSTRHTALPPAALLRRSHPSLVTTNAT